MIAFLALLFILLVIYALTKTKEGFNPMNTSPEHRINIPVNKIPSMLAPASSGANATVGNTVSQPASNGSIFPECDVKASAWPGMLPGPLPTAPYQQIAVGSPLPYQDTSLIKANRQQLINLLEMLKGFLAFEAQEISERSDPTIQLPLQTARTDFHVLQAEVEVLNRNPGLQPTITLSHLNEIGSNLAYLQREVRLIGSAGPIQGPIYEFTKPVEGFTSKGKELAKKVISNVDKSTKSAEFEKMMETVMKRIDPTKLKAVGARIDKAQSTGVGFEEAAADYSTLLQSVTTPEEFKILTGGAADINPEFEKLSEADKKAFNDTLAANMKESDARPTMSKNPRAPKVAEKVVEKSEVITMKQSNAAAAATAAAQKDVASSLLSNVVAANMPAGPSDAASKSVKSGPASFTKKTSSNGKNATLQDLKDFVVRINCESVRLSASGTSDPITNARIVALANIKSDIEDMIRQIEMDPTTEVDITITKAELDKALPILGKPGEPIPDLFKSSGLPPALASLFPSNISNDPLVTKEIGNMADKYLNTFINGLSWQVKYTSPREAQAGGGCNQSEQFMNAFAENKRKKASTIETTGFPSLADLDNASNAKFTPMDSGIIITDRYAPLPSDAGRGPSHFDWKTRSKEIEAQVKKRGLHPADFGIMPPKAKISNDFSWKGYARMMCTRLQATMDPHLPILCGCPPMDWPGWRNAQ